MNLLHKTEELLRFENELFLIDTIYSNLTPMAGMYRWKVVLARRKLLYGFVFSMIILRIK